MVHQAMKIINLGVRINNIVFFFINHGVQSFHFPARSKVISMLLPRELW